MNIKKFFDNPVLATWCLLVVIVFAFILFAGAFYNMDKEGVACQHQPFRWGAMKVLDREVKGLRCYCDADGGDFFRTGFGDLSLNDEYYYNFSSLK